MLAYFGTVISDPTRIENTTFPSGRDNTGFGGRYCNRRGQIIQRYKKKKITLFLLTSRVGSEDSSWGAGETNFCSA